MVILLTIIHILAALILILVVLLQSARGTDMAGAFGGMGSQTAFGPRGTTTFLSKTTAVLAGIFVITSLTLSAYSSRSTGGGGSVLSGEKAVPGAAPAAPAGPKTQTTIIPIQPPSASAPSGAVQPGAPAPKAAAPAAPASPKPAAAPAEGAPVAPSGASGGQ